MLTNTAKNTIVLLGIGHTNAHIVKMWKMHPIPNAQLICVSNFPVATYSGMMPGVLSQQYPAAAIELDLVRLCASAGVRLVVGDVETIDRENQRIKFRDRADVGYDLLSIGVGSRPSTAGVSIAGESLIAVKPMQTFLHRFEKKMAAIADQATSKPCAIAVVGGGLGSIEIAFCLEHRLKNQIKQQQSTKPGSGDFSIALVAGRSGVGSGMLHATVEKIKHQLNARDIAVHSGQRVAAVESDSLTLENGETLPADIVFWTTDATAPELLNRIDLEKDAKGFLLTRSTLQTVSDDRIFAVGDTGTMKQSPTDKAGVYAVRQGPVLWKNLQRVVKEQSLTEYKPQHDYMKLINTGDGSAIMEYAGRAFSGRFAWWLKDRIDRKFMAMYQKYDPPMMKMEKPTAAEAKEAMRCLGCGGKIGGQILSGILAELDIPDHPAVVVGLAEPDDAAVVRTIHNEVTVTNDFFAAPFDDPYLVGRIALLNSASDCFVMGAQPSGVLAMVQLPMQHARAQTRVMRELMSGSVEEINRMGGVIVGGHSIEGPRLTIGFTVLGDQITDLRTKGMLRVGDQLILTKPLGTGVMLAALMQAKLHGMHFQPLIDTMLMSNQIALELMQTSGVSAVTDVTGFGLAGHLKEMLTASRLSAKLKMDQIPVLAGCQQLMTEGIESTLTDDNRYLTNSIVLKGNCWEKPDSAVLYDPQTSGGILCGVAESEVERVLRLLRDHGFESSSVIGEVVASSGDQPSIELK